jgi:hypothetical protein
VNAALCLCLLVGQAAVTAAAPAPIEVSGRVLVKGSRDGVAAAGVTVDGQPAAVTDEQGRFTLSLAPGAHLFHLEEAGFEPLDLTITVGAPAVPLLLRLVPGLDRPRYETVVSGERGEPPGVHLRDEELTSVPGSLGDPFRVIESLPGVTPVLWPLPVYAVRGANPGNTGYFLDGLRVPALFHFALGPAVIHPYFLEGLDFYPGAPPAAYGRSVSGVVAASTAAPPADRVRGSVDVRVFDAGGLLSTPFDGKRGTVTVAGRYGYPGPLLGLLQDEVKLQYWDYQGRIEHSLGPGRLTLALFGSNDRLDRAKDGYMPSVDKQAYLALGFHRADLRWQGPLGRGRLLLALGAGLDSTTTPYQSNGDVAAHGRSLSPRVRYQRALGRVVDWSIGGDGELADYRTQVRGVPTELAADFTRPRKTALLGAWTTLGLRLGEHLTLTPGVRVDRYQEGGAHTVDVEPRLAVSLRASERVTLKAAGGRSSQLPSLPLQLPGFDGFGLAQHGLQTSWQGSLGVEAALPGALGLAVTGFENRFVLTDVRDPDLGDPLLADFLTRRQALSYGLELMLRRPSSQRFYGWLAYTLSRGLRAFEGGVVGPADWDQRHVLNLVTGYRWRRWTFGGRFHLHTGRMVKVEDTTPVDFDRLPPFYQLDLRVDRRFLLDRFAIDVYLEIVNTTLTREVVGLKQRATGYAEDGFRIALPSLGMRAEF